MAKIKEKTEKNFYLWRPPIVALLGHVDHGKTTLLSALLEKDLTSNEAGGITQEIKVHQIQYQGQKITFIDTPGHAAFAKMRSRGAQVTDLAILAVAADEGVKPQTKEALSHIKSSQIPFLVAITKIDLPQASIEMVKNQLAETGVLVEDYGGEIVAVPVSAKEKKGLTDLLEMVLLLAQMQEIKASPQNKLEAVIIEAKLDCRQGPTAVLLIRDGAIALNDCLCSLNIPAKVKAIKNTNGKEIKKAFPGDAVLVLGFKQAPSVGEPVVKITEKEYKKMLNFAKTKIATPLPQSHQNKLKDEKEEQKKFNMILKTDTLGVLEAIKSSLPEEVNLCHAGVGPITESDIFLSLNTKSQIFAFNLKTSKSIIKLANTEKVIIKSYNVIYDLLEEIEKIILKIIEPTIDEEILGEAKIIAEFRIKGNHIAGCKIIKGIIRKKDNLHLKRNGKIIANMKIKSLQKEKEDIEEAKAGAEIGVVFTPDIDFKIEDVIISYSRKTNNF